ncbi:MAG: hypothetical protein GX175_04620 [Halanaerobiaceae bacterium]|nr:hypothetical protein [Halanaerobiaceae bacterium]
MKTNIKELKIKKASNKINLETAQYSVSFKQIRETAESSRDCIYEIISLLKDNNDLLIEMDSSLFFLPVKERETFIKNCINEFRTLNLEYRYSKFTSNNTSLLGLILGKREIERHHLLLYLPHETWLRDEFRSILPIHGIRFYVIPEPLKADELFFEFYRMMDTDKLDYFPLIIFIPGAISHIGLNSKFFTIDDLKKKLRIE